jgi:predicted transcriptional regulator
MKSHLKTSHTKVIETFDKETGEFIDQEVITHKYLTTDKESFYLIYSSLIGLLGEISNPSVKVLSYILLNYKTDTQFELGAASRNMIASKMNLGASSVANALTELKTCNILYSTMKSVYQINPRYAYQGSSSDRKNSIRAIIELGCRNC